MKILNFINTGEMSEEDVNGFIEYCNRENNIIIDVSEEYAETFWKSDLLIADISSIIPEYFVMRKPIIYCHSNINFNYVDYACDMIKSCYEVYNSEELKQSMLYYFL